MTNMFVCNTAVFDVVLFLDRPEQKYELLLFTIGMLTYHTLHFVCAPT